MIAYAAVIFVAFGDGAPQQFPRVSFLRLNEEAGKPLSPRLTTRSRPILYPLPRPRPPAAGPGQPFGSKRGTTQTHAPMVSVSRLVTFRNQTGILR